MANPDIANKQDDSALEVSITEEILRRVPDMPDASGATTWVEVDVAKFDLTDLYAGR